MIRKTGLFISAAFVFFVAAFAPLTVSALEIEALGGLGNIAFDNDRETPIGLSGGSFKGNWFIPIKVSVRDDPNDRFFYKAGYEYDNVLRHDIYADIGVNLDYISISAGPSIGLFVSDALINPGIRANALFSIPGVFFVSMGAMSSLATPMNTAGDYIQGSGEANIGFWVSFVVCSFNFETKRFTLQQTDSLQTDTSENRYFFRADIFTKNVPYTFTLDLGYMTLERSYSSYVLNGSNALEHNKVTDTYKALYVGLQGSYMIFSGFKVVLGGEMPVYSWSAKPMGDPSDSTAFFKVYAGISWVLGEED